MYLIDIHLSYSFEYVYEISVSKVCASFIQKLQFIVFNSAIELFKEFGLTIRFSRKFPSVAQTLHLKRKLVGGHWYQCIKYLRGVVCLA